MKIQFDIMPNGKVARGTWSKTVNGVVFPTNAAVFVFLRAFQIQGCKTEGEYISIQTKEMLAEEFGFESVPMLLNGPRFSGVRTHDEVSPDARSLAWGLLGNVVY